MHAEKAFWQSHIANELLPWIQSCIASTLKQENTGLKNAADLNRELWEAGSIVIWSPCRLSHGVIYQPLYQHTSYISLAGIFPRTISVCYWQMDIIYKVMINLTAEKLKLLNSKQCMTKWYVPSCGLPVTCGLGVLGCPCPLACVLYVPDLDTKKFPQSIRTCSMWLSLQTLHSCGDDAVATPPGQAQHFTLRDLPSSVVSFSCLPIQPLLTVWQCQHITVSSSATLHYTHTHTSSAVPHNDQNTAAVSVIPFGCYGNTGHPGPATFLSCEFCAFHTKVLHVFPPYAHNLVIWWTTRKDLQARTSCFGVRNRFH